MRSATTARVRSKVRVLKQPHRIAKKASRQLAKVIRLPVERIKVRSLSPAKREELVLSHRDNAGKLARSILRRWHARMDLEEVDKLVLEHQGWAESIARSVARAWNMDWRGDGLDGAALEALLFCARRYEPDRGVPFRGYARKRIHEASTEAARKSRGWRRQNVAGSGRSDQEAREISAELLNIFPELRSGEISVGEESGDSGQELRSAIRQLIVGASLIAAKQESITSSAPDEVLDYKRLITLMSTLEPVHQAMMWRIYWEGESMRTVAEEWETDELNIIREHKVILAYLSKTLNTGRELARPRIRPGLKQIAVKLKKSIQKGQFSLVVAHGAEVSGE